MKRFLSSLIAVTLVAVPLGAWGPDAAAPTGTAKAKRCTHGKLLVKVKKRTRCKRLSRFLPRPKRGDVRVAYIKAALNTDASKLKPKRGKKRPRSLKRGFGRAGKKARKKFLRALPRALRKIDRLPRRAAAAARRCGGPGSAQPDSPPGRSDEVSLQGLHGPNGEEGGVMRVKLDGKTFEVIYLKCGRELYSAPRCPEANGDADASSRGSFDVTTRVLDGGKVVSTQYVSEQYQDKLHGKVAADARLDYLDFTRVGDKLIIATGGVAQRGKVTRVARWNMRSGKYDASHSKVTISGDQGVVPDTDGFAEFLQGAIDEYRGAEVGGGINGHSDGWSTLERKSGGYCASAVFSPASGTLKLTKGATGRVSMYAKASDGGKVTGARWTRLGQLNGEFSPASSADREPTVSYRVTAAPRGGRVEMSLKLTSTGGVAKAVWRQPTATVVPLFTGHVSGSGSEVYDPEGGCGDDTGWSYQADLSSQNGGPPQPFRIHPTIEGADDSSTAWGYNLVASETWHREACGEDIPACTATLDPAGVGDVNFFVEGSTVHVTAWTSAWETDDACGDPLSLAEHKIGEADVALSAFDARDVTVPLSFDYEDEEGTTIHNSGTLTLHRVN